MGDKDKKEDTKEIKLPTWRDAQASAIRFVLATKGAHHNASPEVIQEAWAAGEDLCLHLAALGITWEK